ncbi:MULTISPECIES: hypothetical protein [unclassified Lysobacter]|uniref:hypothetical protein n=1 Tax=unclassified Lysobacter TaxID=2635362 RepID=UPI000A6D13EC|nr:MULTISPECIES: hypothetical protein [unclassified Lysobacter]
MKRVLLASLLAACAFAASAQTTAPTQTTSGHTTAGVTTSAQTTSGQTTSARTDVSTQVRTDGTSGTQADTQSKAEVDRNCLRQTGTHIRDRSASNGKGRKGCVAANGRVYTREDIDRTGQTDIAEALRQLDPSIH